MDVNVEFLSKASSFYNNVFILCSMVFATCSFLLFIIDITNSLKLKKNINLETFLYFAMFILFSIFGMTLMEKAINGESPELIFTDTLSPIFGSIITGTISLFVLMKTLNKNEELQKITIENNKRAQEYQIKVEEERIFQNSRTTADFTYFTDDIDLSNKGTIFDKAIYIRTLNYKKVLKWKNAKEQKIIYSSIQNIGNNPMHDVEIYFYEDEEDEKPIDDLTYKHRYLKAGESLIIPLIRMIGNGNLNNVRPSKVLISFTTGLFGKCEEISIHIKYLKDNIRIKPEISIKTEIKVVNKNLENTYDAAEINRINK